MRKIFFILFFILLNYLSFSQQDTIENCLLWEISGNGLSESSYIYGTVHIIPADKFFFFDEWIESLEKCKYLILEVDLKIGFFKQLSLLKQMKMPNDSVLSDYMMADEFDAYRSYMIDSLKVSSAKYNMTLIYKPFFTYSLLLDEVIPGQKIFYEKYLTNLAKDNKMKIIGLETIDFQMNLVNDISVANQIPMFLFDFSKKVQTDFKKEYFKLLDLYATQNLTEINNLEQEADSYPSFYQDFIINRNANWIPIIEKYMLNKPSFIAVGAAHLPGEYGVLKLLENKGYIVKPVCSNLN
ncbi:MAG: TraB/GumN family protein [Bacteroidales bacterium]|nr:TraB/GumN family protein [Bacteroidales bacterium]